MYKFNYFCQLFKSCQFKWYYNVTVIWHVRINGSNSSTQEKLLVILSLDQAGSQKGRITKEQSFAASTAELHMQIPKTAAELRVRFTHLAQSQQILHRCGYSIVVTKEGYSLVLTEELQLSPLRIFAIFCRLSRLECVGLAVRVTA